MAITDAKIKQTMQRFSIIGSSPKLIDAVKRALKIAPIDISVLINGENGTGKEFFPKIIHENSPRKHNKYIAVNCGAIPSGTISSELFGHERGAFTSAEKEHAGYFEVADKGTIFLDEVADLTLDAQARLLRVLESGEYLRVGSSTVRKTDVRVVAATNKDLLQMVRRGEFREDLFYRIAAIRIEVPPLRERGEDIKMLATKFSYDYAEEHHCEPLIFDESAYRELMSFKWSGNVRELQSLVREMSSFESGIVSGDVVKRYLNQKNHSSSLPVVFDTAQHDYTQERELIFKMILPVNASQTTTSTTPVCPQPACSSVKDSKSGGNVLHRLRRTFQRGTKGRFRRSPPLSPAATEAPSLWLTPLPPPLPVQATRWQRRIRNALGATFGTDARPNTSSARKSILAHISCVGLRHPSERRDSTPVSKTCHNA